MQLRGMTIALRPRMPWEATDLGIALVREHARRIFAAWCLVTLPVWVLVNALGLAIDTTGAALLLMWWLKPLFDRIPLYAISRAVFGHTPSVREIVRAQFTWGWREIWPWLLWRRLHPGRLLLLPVDLLERVDGEKRRERVTVLTKGDAGPRNQLIVLGAEFEWVLALGLVLLTLLFVPTEFLSDASRSVYHQLTSNPPAWVLVVLNGCLWFGTSITEPFLVGAGFGLYLNRRVQLEAWDVEHAFRRLAARLARAGQAVCLLLVLAGAAVPSVHAAPASACSAGAAATQPGGANPEGAEPACLPGDYEKPTPTSLAKLFGQDYRSDGGAFAGQVKTASAGMARTVRDWQWQPRDPAKPHDQDTSLPAWLQSLVNVITLVVRYWLWIMIGLLLGVVLYHHRLWLGWIRQLQVDDPASSLETQSLEPPQALPADLPGAVRALWQAGEQRAALALLYKAAVQRLADRLGTPLPPGATEGECLARSRRIGDRRYASLFARIVGCWQAAAYARRMPDSTVLEGLLEDWATPTPVAA